MQHYGIAVNVTPTARLGFELVKEPFHLENESGAADVFTTLYEPEPELLHQPPRGVDDIYYRAWRDALHELLQSAQYQQFHESTVLDHELSGVCVKPVLDELKPLVDRFYEFHREQQHLQDDPGAEQQLERMQLELYAESLRAVSRAIRRAEEAGEAVKALRYIGYGNEAGKFISLSVQHRTIDAVSKLVKRVAHLYGRFLQSMIESSVNTPRKAVMVRGVKLGKCLHHALPSQLAWLSDPDMEAMFMLKWLEGRLLVRDLTTPPQSRRGDVVVCVDESASMQGENAILAKAYAFALREYLRSENRRCHIISFSHYDEDVRELADDADAQEALDWLQSFIGGGTDFHRPLKRAMQLSTERSDILIITDGQANLASDFKNRFQQWKLRTGSRLFMVHLHNESPLRDIADHIVELDEVLSVLQEV